MNTAGLMRRIWPLIFLVAAVGVTSALIAGGVAGGGDRSPAGEPSVPSTVILDLRPTERVNGSPGQGASGEATGTAAAQTETSSGAAGEAPGADESGSSTESTGTAQVGDEEPAGDDGQAGTGEPAADEAAAQDSESTSPTYTVKEGDTPYSIARSLGITVEELMRLNAIEDPTTLQIGDELKVPQP